MQSNTLRIERESERERENTYETQHVMKPGWMEKERITIYNLTDACGAPASPNASFEHILHKICYRVSLYHISRWPLVRCPLIAFPIFQYPIEFICKWTGFSWFKYSSSDVFFRRGRAMRFFSRIFISLEYAALCDFSFNPILLSAFFTRLTLCQNR